MANDSGGALVHLTVNKPLPLEAPAGDVASVTVSAQCPKGCDRTGMAIVVTAPDGGVTSHSFAAHAGGASETAEIALAAPTSVGECAFRVALPAHELAGTRYPEVVLDVPMRVTPQTASLAVWDVPSPIIAGTAFVIKAGAKSAADAKLAGCGVEVRDNGGAIVGRGMLREAPFPDTAALYWTDIELRAPPTEGVATWSARFEPSELELPYAPAGTAFSFAVVRAPEHMLKVKVVEQASAAPISDVELRLGAYRGTTDGSGLAEIALPKGSYELRIWKVGFEAPPQPVEIAADSFVEIAALVVPEEDPDARWKM